MTIKRLMSAAAITAALAGAALWKWGSQMEFLLGGAMVNLGYRLQDRIEDYDFEHHELTPEQVWEEFLKQNRMASSVRQIWPRTARHPLIVMVTCMDARLDTSEIAGDTRRYYYVLRLAGSVLAPKEEDMLELAVANGVKVVVFTTHTDCAAEKMASNPAERTFYPDLTTALAEREQRLAEFLARPRIRESLERHQLIVKRVRLDTSTDRAIHEGG